MNDYPYKGYGMLFKLYKMAPRCPKRLPGEWKQWGFMILQLWIDIEEFRLPRDEYTKES
jgi:hypothetical protein